MVRIKPCQGSRDGDQKMSQIRWSYRFRVNSDSTRPNIFEALSRDTNRYFRTLRTPCTSFTKKSPYSVLNVVPLKYGTLRFFPQNLKVIILKWYEGFGFSSDILINPKFFIDFTSRWYYLRWQLFGPRQFNST